MLDESQDAASPVHAEAQADASGTTQFHALTESLQEMMNWRQSMEHGIFAFQTAVGEHLEALTANSRALAESRIHEQESIGAFQMAAADHLERLSQQLRLLQDQVQSLDYALHATPYMADPAVLKVTDSQGRVIIGFSSRTRAPENVYRGFEDIFRGPETFIRERQRTYLPLLAGHNPVLDVGCGRGEFLDLLAEAHIPAIGLDLDEGMVARTRAKGHQVVHIDALEYLRNTDPQSFGVIFAAQVIEHLSYDELLDFLRLARHALQPGGLLITETVNPHALPAFKTFWTDLTHHNPIFPEVLTILCHLTGYHSAAVFFPNGSDQFEQDRRTQGEYAVIATTPGHDEEVTNPLLVLPQSGESTSA